MTTATSMLVYKQTTLPYFEYCDFLISCCKKEKDKLEKLQYRVEIMVFKMSEIFQEWIYSDYQG